MPSRIALLLRRLRARSRSVGQVRQKPGPRSTRSRLTTPCRISSASCVNAYQSLRRSTFDGEPPASDWKPEFAVPHRKLRGKRSASPAAAGAAAAARATSAIRVAATFTVLILSALSASGARPAGPCRRSPRGPRTARPRSPRRPLPRSAGAGRRRPAWPRRRAPSSKERRSCPRPELDRQRPGSIGSALRGYAWGKRPQGETAMGEGDSKVKEMVSGAKRRIGAEAPVAADDDSRTGVVRGALKAFGQGDMETFVDALKDDVHWENPEGDNFPGCGEMSGAAEVRESFIGDVGRTYTSFGFRPES